MDTITSEEPTATQSEIFGTIVEWGDSPDQVELRMGATIIPQLKQMLRRLAAEGDSIAAYGKRTGVVFEIGTQAGWREDESLLIVSLTRDAAARFADQLRPKRGEYRNDFAESIKITVVPIDIKNGEGQVIKTVG